MILKKPIRRFLFDTHSLSASAIPQIKGRSTYPFSFEQFDKKYETYHGKVFKTRLAFTYASTLIQVNRYFIHACLMKENRAIVQIEQDFAVHLPVLLNMQPRLNRIRMGELTQGEQEPRIDVTLDLRKTRVYMDELVIGKLTIMKMNIRIKEILLVLIKNECIRYYEDPLDALIRSDSVVKYQEVTTELPLDQLVIHKGTPKEGKLIVKYK